VEGVDGATEAVLPVEALGGEEREVVLHLDHGVSVVRGEVLGSRFWVLGSGFWVPGSGFWVLGSGFWVLGSGFWVLVVGRRVVMRAFCFDGLGSRMTATDRQQQQRDAESAKGAKFRKGEATGVDAVDLGGEYSFCGRCVWLAGAAYCAGASAACDGDA
jgi:hypothetical protein